MKPGVLNSRSAHRAFAMAVATAALWSWGCRPAAPARITTASIVPSQILPSTPALMDAGAQTYRKQCEACHGKAGDGRGEAAYLLYPRPRDFTRGEFRLVSTWEGVPTDEDLFRTISRGMPGSAMPSWAHLTEESRWGLVHYVKSLSNKNAAFNPNKRQTLA